jgi:hypothetical protein
LVGRICTPILHAISVAVVVWVLHVHLGVEVVLIVL